MNNRYDRQILELQETINKLNVSLNAWLTFREVEQPDANENRISKDLSRDNIGRLSARINEASAALNRLRAL